MSMELPVPRIYTSPDHLLSYWAASGGAGVMVLETSVLFKHLTRLIAREDFIEFSRRVTFRSYTVFRLFICSMYINLLP